jgi:hypothetical protein
MVKVLKQGGLDTQAKRSAPRLSFSPNDRNANRRKLVTLILARSYRINASRVPLSCHSRAELVSPAERWPRAW